MKLIRSILSLYILLVFSSCSEEPEFEGPGIHNYFCSSGRMRLGDGMRNASGITFNHDTGTLFIIQDSPTWIYELSIEGEIIRTIRINNADDTEGIAYIGKGVFAILEESTSKIYFCKIDESSQSIDFKTAEKVVRVNDPDENTGLEGVTFIREKNVLYAVKEKSPKVIYRIEYESGKVTVPWDIQKIGITDVSGVCYNPKNNSLLLLSHESFLIVEVDMQGNRISQLVLRKKRNGLKKDIKKAEGITVDPKTGRIYICGEKEEFYIFEDATR